MKNKINDRIEELEVTVKAAAEKTAKCTDLATYMAKVRAPINLRIIDLALGISANSKKDKKTVSIERCLKDKEVLKISKLLDEFIANVETPFMESLVVPNDEGIPLTVNCVIPKVKKNKKGIIEMAFQGTSESDPLSMQLLNGAAVQELAVFGKEFHKKVLRNRILIAAGVTILITGIGVTTYVLMTKNKKSKDEHDDECDMCPDCPMDGPSLNDIVDSVPMVAID